VIKNNSLRGISMKFALAVMCWHFGAASLPAQTVNGTILGVVQDQQGAVIGKAEISARSLDTGAIRKAVSEDNGTYRISSVPAGSYEVSVSIAGFKTEVRSGIDVTVGADVAVNFALTVGAISEKVEVTAEAPQVDASSSTLGGFVNSNTIRELPLNGRDWISLSLLQPGVNANGSQNQNDLSRAQRGNGISLYISGGRHTDNSFRIDGISVNDYANGGPGSSLRVNMGVDAIREFSVLTNNYSAEYGRGAGGIVNAITKSGTNGFHGSAYYFHRNSALDARNFFDGPTIPAFRRHQYGGALGGPIKKDKTFFFANFERLTEIKGLTAQDPTLSANAQKGLLCANPACSSLTQVPISPKSAPFITLFPLPTAPASNSDIGFFVFSPKRDGKENYVTSKIDHYFSAATTFFGSYTYDNTNVAVPDNYNLKDTFSSSKRQYGVLSLQHLFSPTVINNARAGVTRFYGGNAIDGNPRDPRLTDPNFGFVPGHLFGQIIISGVAIGTSTGVPSGIFASGENFFGYTSPQFYDDLSWTKGRHSIRAGFNVEHIMYNIFEPSKPNGVWQFGSIRDFLSADLSGAGSNFNGDYPGTDATRSEHMTLYGAYVQDDFRILPNLTINMGMRYEVGTPVDESHNRIANLRNLTDTQVTVGGPYYNTTKTNFAPRVGFAWDPRKDGKTAVRGGFGMFDIVPLPYMFTARYPRSAPFFKSIQLNNPPSSAFPNQIQPLLLIPSALLASHVEFNPSRSYRMQWNLNIQRQLTRSMALTVGYSGSSGVHLIHQEEDTNEVPASLVTIVNSHYVFPTTGPIQRINPNFGAIRASDWNGQSNYHGLQTNLVQRPIKGLTYQVAYTWSKSIDNGSGVFQGGNESFNTAAASWAFDPRINRGVSDYNIPHNFVVNAQYDIPVPAGVKTHALANTVLGGWQVGGIYTRQSGGPFTFRIGADRARTGNTQITGSNGAQRPEYVAAPGCTPNATTGDTGNYIKTQCFAFPQLGVLGNLGRNTLTMPTFRDLDFTVFKNQNLWGEKIKAQFRVEMFNVLNNTNFTAQMQTLFDGSGNLVSSVRKPINPTANASRQIQLGLRILF
jgi:hypothetical protein